MHFGYSLLYCSGISAETVRLNSATLINNPVVTGQDQRTNSSGNSGGQWQTLRLNPRDPLFTERSGVILRQFLLSIREIPLPIELWMLDGPELRCKPLKFCLQAWEYHAPDDCGGPYPEDDGTR